MPQGSSVNSVSDLKKIVPYQSTMTLGPAKLLLAEVIAESRERQLWSPYSTPSSPDSAFKFSMQVM